MNLDQLARYDIKLLVALQVLLEESNVTRAAERLHVTQSAMSKMLARLTDTFGEELFTRTSHGIQPTDRAIALKSPLNDALNALGVLLTPPIFKPIDCNRTFRLSIIDGMAIRVVPGLLSTLSKVAPNVRIQFKPWGKDSFDDLASGQLDLAINVVDIDRANFYQQKLADIQVCAVVRKGHPLCRKKLVDLDQFLSYPFIKVVIPEFNENQQHDQQILSALGKIRNIAIETPNQQLALECVSKTDYLMLGGKAGINPYHEYLGLTTIDVPKELSVPSYSMKLSWHQRQHNPPEHVWFRKLLLNELMKLAQ